MEFNITEESPWRKYFVTLVIILVSALSFGIGRLTAPDKREGIRIEDDPSLTSQTIPTSLTASSIVASKNSKKYHYTSCPGAKQISEKNRITFSSPEAAEASGYSLATNCQPN